MTATATFARSSPASAAALAFGRHRGPVTCAVGIPGRRAVLLSGYDSAVSWVDLETSRIELLGYHEHLVNRIVVDAQGARAASCSSDFTVCLWDLEARRPLRVLRGHDDDVEDFAFVDAHTGVSASRDRRILVWDLDSGAVLRVLLGHEKDVLSVVSAGQRLYSSGDDKTLREWDLKSGEPRRVWGPFEVETDTCAVDARNELALLGADDGCLYVFDTRLGGLLRRIEAHASGIKKVAVSPADGAVLTAAYDQRLRVWDAATFSARAELEKHAATWERSLNFSPDGREIYGGTFDGTLVVWDASSGRKLCEIGAGALGHRGNACLNDVATGAGGRLATVSDDGYVRLGRLTPAEAAWTTSVEPRSGRMLMNAVTLDGDRLVAGAHDHKLHLFRLRDGGLEDEIEVALGEGPINCVRICRTSGYEGECFVACYSHAVLRVSPTGELLGRIGLHAGAVKALRLHPTRPLGVSCGADGLLLSWDFEGRLVERFQGHMAIVDDVDVSPSGGLVASSGRDFTLKVYDLASGKLLHSLDTGHQSPKSVAFVDERTVVVGNYWGWLVRADLETGRVTRRRIAPNGLSALARSGEHLVAAGYDGAAYLVRPSDLEVLGSLRAMTQKLPHEPVTRALRLDEHARAGER